MLVTSDGRVDTSTLLASIVAEARIATGGAAPEIPDVPLGSSEGVEVRVVQRATGTEQYRFYTVNPGDSLGSIAVKFYGSVGYYPEIFEANRAKLSSPDRIQAGQRLVIPNLG
jgi:nucleoid-associated protein YgaU